MCKVNMSLVCVSNLKRLLVPGTVKRGEELHQWGKNVRPCPLLVVVRVGPAQRSWFDPGPDVLRLPFGEFGSDRAAGTPIQRQPWWLACTRQWEIP